MSCIMGLPCVHKLQQYVSTKTPIPILDIYQHWRLYTTEELPPIDLRDCVLEPEVVQRGKGRPAGSTNHTTATEIATVSQPTASQRSTTRDPSGYEYVLAQEQPSRGRARCGGQKTQSNRGHGRGGVTTTRKRVSIQQQHKESNIETNEEEDSEDSEGSEEEGKEEGQLRRSRRAGRGQAAAWLGDEN
ncbi:hypothetical protein BDV26DRAFT_256127 [Aspergillus bertholletiae]|uniref:Uncharacterized protein n=1 Tax=Aspergillus bertholletiae TaxID=1226010 RepID=A0A5N7BHQ3_9EURO|nr:hypothetical protein BDV26DRAFT_256127 [Aspergillus bertholletiae]